MYYHLFKFFIELLSLLTFGHLIDLYIIVGDISISYIYIYKIDKNVICIIELYKKNVS